MVLVIDPIRYCTSRASWPGTAGAPCELCGGILKSDTISFGQALIPEVIDRAMQVSEQCDLMLAVGSTLSVYPAAACVPIAAAAGATTPVIGFGCFADKAPARELGLGADRLKAAGFSGELGQVLTLARENGPVHVAIGLGRSAEVDAGRIRDAAAAFAVILKRVADALASYAIVETCDIDEALGNIDAAAFDRRKRHVIPPPAFGRAQSKFSPERSPGRNSAARRLGHRRPSHR